MLNQLTQPLAPPIHDAALVRKILSRLLPFLCLLFLVNYIDRANIGMAKLRMCAEVGISDSTYGLGAGLFFVGYFLFEIPSNLLLERLGARIWITRIMVTWGLISAAMMFVRGPVSFSALRFLLGLAEAGFFPGIILYLTYWVPSRYRALAMSLFLTSTATSGILGNPLAGLLMNLDGLASLRGWQWLFLLEGLLPVALGVVTLLFLPDRPADARWLTDSEKSWLAEELASDTHHPHHHVAELRSALRDPRLWRLAALYFSMIMGLYGFVYWTPTMIQSVSPPGTTPTAVGLYAALPYLVGALTMVLIARHSDHTGERRRHVAACCLTAAAGVLLVTPSHTPPAMLASLSLAAVGIFGTLGPFWALATRFLRASAAAPCIAIVNSIGGLAGFVAPYAIGLAKQHTGTPLAGWALVAASLTCGSLLVLTLPPTLDSRPTA